MFAFGLIACSRKNLECPSSAKSCGSASSRQKLLLRNTDRPLSEIAGQTGFCNAAYLANVFHRETGMPPGAWRKDGQ